MKLVKNLFYLFFFFSSFSVLAQNEAVLKIDTSRIVFKPGLSFPYWLNAGQSLKKETNVKAISVLEFVLDSSGNLRFSKPMSIIAAEEQVVPEGRVWKIESVGLIDVGFDSISTAQATATQKISSKPSMITSPAKFTEPGTYSWTVPPGVTNICVEVWGGGGNGGQITAIQPYINGNGGGGGGYGYECFSVLPMSKYIIIVGGAAETSRFGELIYATGGKSSQYNYIGSPFDTILGIGGMSNAFFNIEGTQGGIFNAVSFNYGSGGSGANGGKGGRGGGDMYSTGANGVQPGGGGGGGNQPGSGAPGQVIIHW